MASNNAGKGKGSAQAQPQPGAALPATVQALAAAASLLPQGSVQVAGNGAQPVTLAPAAAVAAWLAGNVQGAPQPQAVANALHAAGYTYGSAAKALAVLALRHATRTAWAAAGQAAGYGNPRKARSGGSGARAAYNAATGNAGKRGSVATANAPTVQRTTGQQQGAQQGQQASGQQATG